LIDQGQPKNVQSRSEDAHLIIDPEFETLMQPLTQEEYEALEKSLIEEDCRDAVVVDRKTKIVVEGINRVKICRKHNIPIKISEKDFANTNEMKVWALKNQLARRNLTPYGKATAGYELASLLIANEAKQRQREHAGTAPGKSKTLSSNLTEVLPLDVRKEAARIAGVGVGTIHMVKVINEKATEQEKAQLRDPNSWVTVHKVFRRIRRDELKTQTPAFPADKYGLIYADPPWTFEFTECESRTVQNHYATMTFDELALLPIASIAQNDCVLAMWAPNCKLDEASRLMSSWGFKYEANIVWIKPTPGLGHHVRNQHELLLIAVKGNPPTPLPKNRPSSVMYAPRGTRHSEKPVKAYEILEKMYPQFKKIELFARKHRAGWLAWGNEVT
jgi:N6-adenosine-specific RNA methylase IME4